MTLNACLPVVTVASSFILGLIIFALPEHRHRLRTTLNLIGAGLKLGLVFWMLNGVTQGQEYHARYSLIGELALVFRVDLLALYFATLSTLLWLLTTIYAVGYLENGPNRSRFFGFFSLCTSATVGVALAGNVFTFIIFFELLTLSTYPLIAHRGTEEARRAAKIYLRYSLAGGACLLFGSVWLYTLTGSLAFKPQGFVSTLPPSDHVALTIIFVLMITGVGVKAALFPLHGWLPKAMVAPAPVSSLLHAVAVVKAGAFGVIRIVYEVYGIEFADALSVTTPLAYLAAFTIIYGSVRALFQNDLKKRLAYSTISQISYIILGVALVGPIATIGGLVHLIHQGLMKITLFFCAGNFAETLGIHDIDELDGVGKRMPWTATAFTVAALALIGIPPLAGFLSKWYLSLGALELGQPWVLGILIASSLLNAGYFLPIIHRMWFKSRTGEWQQHRIWGRHETGLLLLGPTVAAATSVVLVGVFASSSYSPFAWAIEIVAQEFMKR
ncbi:MAG TPA: proton-conducting transporter membrane subunit [Marinagarivorans sp.]